MYYLQHIKAFICNASIMLYKHILFAWINLYKFIHAIANTFYDHPICTIYDYYYTNYCWQL